MRKTAYLALLAFLTLACGGKDPVTPDDNKDPDPGTQTPAGMAVPEFAKGADISWVTEMESRGLKFSNSAGKEMECTALMKELGMNSIRLRVWVNPEGGWCGAADVLAKAKRASALGMNLMIDFHYSDSWADPGKQNVPAAWKSLTSVQAMAKALSDHTKEVLTLLKDNKIDVSWVQVGNETPDGFLWEMGRASRNPGNFATLVNAGYDAVKAVYPEAKVIVHVDNAYDLNRFTWLFDLLKANGGRYDMIGMSLYPSYWDDSIKDFPDWKDKTQKALNNIPILASRYGKELMIVETGMPESRPDMSYEMLSHLLKNARALKACRGVFYWEPESSSATNGGYSQGAFSSGRPTKAMNAFTEN